MIVEVIIHSNHNQLESFKNFLVIPKYSRNNDHETDDSSDWVYFNNNPTNEEKIGEKARNWSDNGKNIYLRCKVVDVQQFYRRLSKNQLTLVDSRISRELTPSN